MENNKNDPVKVSLVNPPIADPWRTHQDYLEEQRRDKIQFRITIAAIVLSFLSVVATAIIAIESLKRMTELQASKVNGIDSKLFAKAETQLKKHLENLRSEGRNSPVKWGAVRNLHFKLSPGDYDDTLSAVLVYEENFSFDSRITPFTSFDRCELNLIYSEGGWHFTGGTHRFFSPNSNEQWKAFTGDEPLIKMVLDMDFYNKSN